MSTFFFDRSTRQYPFISNLRVDMCGQWLVLVSPGKSEQMLCAKPPQQDLKAFFSPGEPAVNRCPLQGWGWSAMTFCIQKRK